MTSLHKILWIFDFGLKRMTNNLPPGWAPPIGVFACIALLEHLAREMKVNMQLPIIGLAAIDVCVTIHFLKRLMRNLLRLGLAGPSRARWWIEMAAVFATLFLSGTSLHAFQFFKPAAGQGAAGPVLLHIITRASWYFVYPLWACAITGFLLGVIRGRQVRGRSIELVVFSFWSSLMFGACIVFIPQQMRNGNAIGAASAFLGITAAFVAAFLATRQWWKLSRANSRK